MDLKSPGAAYIREKMANWQQGFAMLYVEGNHVVPQLVPINGLYSPWSAARTWG